MIALVRGHGHDAETDSGIAQSRLDGRDPCSGRRRSCRGAGRGRGGGEREERLPPRLECRAGRLRAAPGMYFSDINYYYSASASAAAADSILLGDIGNITREARLGVESDAFVTIPGILWVPQAQLFGGRFGVGVLAPVGWQQANGSIEVERRLTLANGHTHARGSRLEFGDETTSFGDPLVTAFLGWDSGNWHTKVTGLLNIPIGAYDQHNLVNMGFNRWAFDASGAVTWLDPRMGLEVSLAAGFTFNGRIPTPSTGRGRSSTSSTP